MPGPFDCWLVLRGVKTLALRMERHCANARAVAEFLDAHPAVERVLWPGLPRTPATRSPRARCATSAAWCRFLAETEEEAVALVARTRIFRLAESLGGVESLIEHPGG